jgi:uncharacterized membrane protein YkgB
MSRMSMGGDQILVKPTNNIYTVLTVVGIIVEIVAIIYVIMISKQLFGVDWLGNPIVGPT